MKRNGAILLASLLGAGVCCGSCSDSSGGTPPREAAAPILQVQVARVISQELDTTVTLPAQLAAYEQVDVYPRVTGFVKSIAVDRGSRVKQGERLAQLEAPELLAERAEAEAKFQSAESQLAAGQAKLTADQATYRRMSQAARTPGVVAANDVETARQTALADSATAASLDKTARAAGDAVRAIAQLQAYLTITAPFDGQVTARYVHPGALAGPEGGPGGATPIVRIETLTRDRVVVPVPEYDAASVPAGSEVAFTVPSFPGRTFRGRIARISHEVDLKTRTMPVELDVRDPRGELVPGTFCRVRWRVRRSYPTLFVPVSAVASDLEQAFVIRVRGGRAGWVEVKTGETVRGEIEVFGDLRAGDNVVLNASDSIGNGAAVSARGQE